VKKGWFLENASRFRGQLLFDERLSKHTYYRIGGPAKILAHPKGVEDLALLSEGIGETGIPYFVMGAGSNLLVSDEGFAGLVIRMSKIDLEIAKEGSLVRSGAGVAVSTLLRRAAQEGWAGLDFLTGVPGSIGGVIAMKAGTHLGEAKDKVKRVEAFDLLTGKPLVFEGDALKFEYRKNLFLPSSALVTRAFWQITQASPESVKAAIDEVIVRRKATQPVDYPSCGSVFKNPKASGKNAWQVVDSLGLRGHRIGNAQFAEKHSNFIINLGGAKASEVRALIDLAKTRAKAELGIELEEEVKFVGRFA
jgi:UDP-N-acetylmuramate dehydrogenase